MKKTVSIFFWLYATASLAIILLFLLSVVGCQSIGYSRKEPNGELITFNTSSLWSKKQIKSVTYGASTNGTRSFTLKGYTDNQTEVAIEALIAALQAYSNQHPPTPPANPAP